MIVDSPKITGVMKVFRPAVYNHEWQMEFFKEDVEGLPEDQRSTPWDKEILGKAVNGIMECLVYEAAATVKDFPPKDPIVLTVRIELMVEGLPLVAETNFASNRVNEDNLLEQVEYLHGLLDYQILQPMSSILITLEE